MDLWTSPDGKIKKKLLIPGESCTKPYENSTVHINILPDCPNELTHYNNRPITIGFNSGELGRLMDNCICTMNVKERAQLTLTEHNVSFTCELRQLEFSGLVHEWDAKKKYDFAMKHKANGIEYYNTSNYLEAGYCFTKALKLLLLLPIDVECSEDTVINGLSVTEISTLKAVLYNNLSSCYFKKFQYDKVLDLCLKVLKYDAENVKALYKLGVAYNAERNYEKALAVLDKIMVLEPDNRAAADLLSKVKLKLREQEFHRQDVMKKMISGIIYS